MSMRTSRCMHSWTVTSVTVLVVTTWLTGDAAADPIMTTINKNAFTNNTGKKETDFHLIVQGTLKEAEFVDDNGIPFPNMTITPGNPSTADFSGGTLDIAKTGNLSFKATGVAKNDPRGYFTPDGDTKNPIHSIDPNGVVVAINPQPNNSYDGVLSITNGTGLTLTGSITVYINTGILSNLSITNFDVLNNATQIYSNPNFNLAPDQNLTTLTAHLADNQYFLMVGSANDGDGSGSHPYATGISSSAIPEPSPLTLLIVMGGLLLGTRLKKGTWVPS
jgi:hypothetical protein